MDSEREIGFWLGVLAAMLFWMVLIIQNYQPSLGGMLGSAGVTIREESSLWDCRRMGNAIYVPKGQPYVEPCGKDARWTGLGYN